MKILVISQHYWPEPFTLTDVCEELVNRGHEVHVITDIPNYPMGYIYDDYKNDKNRRQERNGVKITRTFTIGRRNNVIFRMLNYFSYAISSTVYVKKLKEEYDVVFTNQTSPIMMVNAAMAYAKKHGKKTVLYCMDLWPASLKAGGISESSPIYKVFKVISEKLYKKADRILITSSMFREYLKTQFEIKDEIISHLPQFALSGFETETLEKKQSKETVDFMFAGNIGAAQSLDTIVKAADILRENEKLRFHLVGDGSQLENLKDLAQNLNLSNVIFHGRKPMEVMPKYYSMADAMLVTLTKDPVISLTLPAKVQTYMAAGKPVIAAASGEIKNVINAANCGFCAEAEDSQGLANAIKEFLAYPEKDILAKNAKEYYNENFTKKLFMDKLENELLTHVN